MLCTQSYTKENNKKNFINIKNIYTHLFTLACEK